MTDSFWLRTDIVLSSSLPSDSGMLNRYLGQATAEDVPSRLNRVRRTESVVRCCGPSVVARLNLADETDFNRNDPGA